MATALSLNDINSITTQFIEPKLVDNFFKSAPLFVLMRNKQKEEFVGGTYIQLPISYAPLNGGPTSRGATFDTSYVQTDTAMTFNVKFYYVNATLFGTDNVLNIGPQAAISNIEGKMANASETMALKMGTDMFLDGQGIYSSTLALDGLYAACNDGTNYAHGESAVTTYGGIPRASLATGSNVGINGYTKSFYGLSLGLSDIQTAYGASTFGRKHVDVMVSPQPVWDLVWSKIQPQQRFLEESSDLAKIGFRAQRFNGCTLVVDQYAPAGTLYGLNTEFLTLYISTNRLYQFGFTGWKEAQNTADVAGQYMFAGNMTYSNPRTSFQLVDITN